MNETSELIAKRFADDREIVRLAQSAVWEALRNHKETGDPIAVWRDGKVVIIPPEEIVVPEREQENAYNAEGESGTLLDPKAAPAK